VILRRRSRRAVVAKPGASGDRYGLSVSTNTA
jgi:hypothetical protein